MITQSEIWSNDFSPPISQSLDFAAIVKIDRRLEQLAALAAFVQADEFSDVMVLTRSVIGPTADSEKQPNRILRTSSARRTFDLEVSRLLKLGGRE